MLNQISMMDKVITYRATRPVEVLNASGAVVQNLSKVYKYRDALVEALAIQCICTGNSFEVVTLDEAIALFEGDKTRFTSFTFIKIKECVARTITTKKWSGYKPKAGSSGKQRAVSPDQYSVLDTQLARGMSKDELESGRAMRSFNKNTLVSMKHNGKLYLIA